MRSPSDDELLDRAVRGDERALESLFRRYYKTVFRFAHKICPFGTDAEDITQEVFLKLTTNIAAFDRRSAFSTWLYRVTMNSAIDARRRDDRRGQLNDDYLPFSSGCEPAKQESAVLARQIIDVVVTFPERERDAVLLVLAEGLTQKQAAAVIGCPLGSIGGLLKSAQTRLNSILEGQRDGPENAEDNPQPGRNPAALAGC